MSIPARLSALTRAQIETVNGGPGHAFPPCQRCGGTAPNGWDYCRACHAKNGQEWREARDRGDNDGRITLANWRK